MSGFPKHGAPNGLSDVKHPVWKNIDSRCKPEYQRAWTRLRASDPAQGSLQPLEIGMAAGFHI